MNNILTFEEIQKSYDKEWVFLDDVEIDECNRIKKGNVLFHSKKKSEVYKKAKQLSPKSSAILYMGESPEDMAFIL